MLHVNGQGTKSSDTTGGPKKKRYRKRYRNKNSTKNSPNTENRKEEKVDQTLQEATENSINVENLQVDQSNHHNSVQVNTSSNKPTMDTIDCNSEVTLPTKDDPITKKSTQNSTDGLAKANENASPAGKTREEIMAEREAKKLAKQAKKNKAGAVSVTVPAVNDAPAKSVAAKSAKINGTAASIQLNLGDVVSPATTASDTTSEKSRGQIMAEREAKKQAKQAAKAAKTGAGAPSGVSGIVRQVEDIQISQEQTVVQTSFTHVQVISEEKKKAALTKAERRAIQEAQRAAKAQLQAQKVTSAKPSSTADTNNTTKPSTQHISDKKEAAGVGKNAARTPLSAAKSHKCQVKLFNHLESAHKDVSLFLNNSHIHPSMVRLGEQYAKRTVVGSNARCVAFLNALKAVVQDFETPPKKEFSRSLEISLKSCVNHLHNCRPLAVSVTNAFKHIKHLLTQLPADKPESELKENFCHFIETYIENQIEKAAQAISSSMQEKIVDGDVILTFGCSSLINYICEQAQRRQVNFRVIIVDSRPFCEGQELLRRLVTKEIPCTYVLINALGFVMPEATKVLLGAHALLSNGYVMARTGTAQVALVARSHNVPVLVCCETHKFSERFQTDAIVYNELGNPDDLIINDKCSLTNWQQKSKMSPLNLIYDITPPELVTAVVTEVSTLPCTSVPVILRIKPTEIGYYS